MGQIVRSNYYISIFNPDFHQPFPFNHGANQVKHSDQAATCERITTTRTLPGTRVAHPFIQICTPIYHLALTLLALTLLSPLTVSHLAQTSLTKN